MTYDYPNNTPELERLREENEQQEKLINQLLEALKLAQPILYYIRRYGWDEAPPFGSALDEVMALTKTDEAIAHAERDCE